MPQFYNFALFHNLALMGYLCYNRLTCTSHIMITRSPYFMGRFTVLGRAGGSDKVIMTGTHDYRIVQNNFTKNPCSANSSLPLSPANLGDHRSFYCLHSFTFFRMSCSIVGIIRCVAFSFWLSSFTNMHLRFLHVFPWLDSRCLCIAE